MPDADHAAVGVGVGGALEQEVADFHDADIAEDKTRENLASGTMALTLYKTELSQAREAQLGAIQNPDKPVAP